MLNLFCKVRGAKIIVGFLNNEPRYLEPILFEFERQDDIQSSSEDSTSGSHAWKERYVLLLWLSHLMLTPFDLATISSGPVMDTSELRLGIQIPDEVPELARRVLQICVDHIASATKEKDAAGALLVRLIVRPDMRKIGLLDAVIQWTLSSFSAVNSLNSNIHEHLGILSFISRLVAAASTTEIGSFLPQIHKLCLDIIGEDTLIAIRSSAVARKLIIKVLRNVVIHTLQPGVFNRGLDPDRILEDVIDYLLQALADGDTPVRYTASKALSVITLKLDPTMAEEVVEAILGSLNEDVIWEGPVRNLNAVNPLRWHGLTLTLAHLLFRRVPSSDRLPDVVNALLLALVFEQRSSTGRSIGTNVRDAANFGVWALSRRYTTKELLAVRTQHVKAAQATYHSVSVPQALAVELVVAACLDPAGNIRRGSSAALQELIGRHPDTVVNGIPLVQAVDFHAVGLRERAICEVALEAGRLDQLYWNAIFEGLLDWRGVVSIDAPSREFAATAIAKLSQFQSFNILQAMVDRMTDRLKRLSRRDVEERHGLFISLSKLITRNAEQTSQRLSPDWEELPEDAILRSGQQLHHLQTWSIFVSVSPLEDRDFTSTALRPELTAVATCHLLSALCFISCIIRGQYADSWIIPPYQIMKQLLDLCLARTDGSVLQLLTSTAYGVLNMNEKKQRDAMIEDWIMKLEQTREYSGLKGSGPAIALGAAFGTVRENGNPLKKRIVDLLASRCTTIVGVHARTIALQSFQIFVARIGSDFGYDDDDSTHEHVVKTTCNAFLTGLNDYTINERGDIGSLVRLEALKAVEEAWSYDAFSPYSTPEFTGKPSVNDPLIAAIFRLSVEKLDKVRMQAFQCLRETCNGPSKFRDIGSATGVSSYGYFFEALQILVLPEYTQEMKTQLLEGYVSSAGMGSESVVQSSRRALIDFLDTLPVFPSEKANNDESADESSSSLFEVMNIMTSLLSTNLTNDRIVLPILDVLSFLFDMQIVQRLQPRLSPEPTNTNPNRPLFKFKTLLSLLQKSHFKSTNVQKLQLALDVYRGFADIHIHGIRDLVVTKVVSLLSHPFPKVCIFFYVREGQIIFFS